MKRIIALGLVLLLLLSLFSACKAKNPADSTEETTAVGQSGFALRKDGVAPVFRYSVLAEGDDFTLAKKTAEKLARYLGVKVTRKDDSNPDPNAVEILFGSTSYDESALMKTELGYGGGIVSIVGNKLVIIATDTTELSKTFDRFFETLSQFKQESGDYLIPEGYTMTSNYNETLQGLPTLAGKKPVLYDEGDDGYLLHFSKSTESDYTAYLNTFLDAGYRTTAANNLEGNLFTTVTNGEKIVNLIWTPNTKDLRVTVDPAQTISLPTSAAENVYDRSKNIESTITQVGLWYGDKLVEGSGENSGVSCEGRLYAAEYFAGMSYVIRLSDGSFILIDGGYGTDYHITNLYEVLRKQAPDPDHIVIASWIFSHAHDDHVGVVAGFLQRYVDKITVEQFLFNFPTATRGQQDGGGGALESQVRNALKNNALKDAKIVKAHAGQVDYIRNAKVEILFTLEMMEPYQLSYYNDCSVIFTIEIDGHKMLITGDCGPSVDRHEEGFLTQIYTGQTLRADILQLTHHAITDNTKNYTFEYAQPDWVFVPAAMWQVAVPKSGNRVTYCNDKERGYNAPVVAMPEDHVFMAGKGIQILNVSEQTCSAQTWETVADYLADPA